MKRLLLVIAAVLPLAALAQAYPSKPVRMIVPFPPGGPADIFARGLAQGMHEPLGQPVVIENIGGVGGVLGVDRALKSAPDGYTLGFNSGSTLSIAPYSLTKLPYDVKKDAALITLVVRVPEVLTVHPSLPVASLPELIAYAKANPGKVNFGSAGGGSITHLAGELLKAEAKVDLVHVPYKGAAPARAHRAVRRGERSRIAWHAAGLRRLPRRRAGEVEPGRVGDRFQGKLGLLIDFFLKLKSHKLPVSIKEYLTLLEAMDKKVIGQSVDEFYYLSRCALVKDDANFDKFDRAFAEFWQGVETIPGIETRVPLEWLLKQVELTLSEEEKKQIEALGGWEKLMETLKQRLEEQKGRHQGGAKWIGTAGTSPFGAYGYNPEGVRIGQERSRNRSAVKVWDQREYRNLDDSVELGTRNIKVALRRLRKFAREGAPEEFDLENTIYSTARKAYLDIHMRPERRNAIKVLMLMDIGGTMDDHVKLAAELFSAAKTEFKHLEFFYFHNCLYDFVWKDNRRRSSERTRTWDLLHKYGHDYKVIFVGDATMSPY